MKRVLLTCLILLAVAPFHAGGDETTSGTGNESKAAAMPAEPTWEEIQAARAAVRENPTDPDAHMRLAVLFGRAMRAKPMVNGAMYADTTVATLKKVIQLDPKRTEAYLGLARFYLHAPPRAGGSIAKAEEVAHQLAGIDPEQGKQLLAQIEASKNGGAARPH